jgi:hypothetical protein
LYKEHVLKEYNAAFEQYQLAIGLGKQLEGFADHFKSIAYLGSGRILAERNDPNANTYLKEAISYAETTEVENEAKEILNQ